MKHAGAVRATHWIYTVAFIALTVSGIGITVTHPRFYWGETGHFGMPAAFELPMAPSFQTSWGRAWHFLAAWVAVLNGLAYVGWGLWRRHFTPAKLVGGAGYNVYQRAAYFTVVFALFPLIILTGLTMSPGITAAYPELFTIFGGRQSARTLHFLASCLLVAFAMGHVFMVARAGFREKMRGML